MAKHLVQLVFTGVQVVGRAFARALKQEIAASQAAAARAGGGARGEEHSATNQKLGLTLEEAKQILNVDELSPEKLKENYEYLFSINDRTKGGSFYLQSKMRTSHEKSSIKGLPTSTSNCSPVVHHLLSVRAYSSSYKNMDDLLLPKNKEQGIKNLQTFTPFVHAKIQSKKQGAVLVPLCHVDGKLSLLYTHRSGTLSSHKGEICFPGGRIDPKDDGPVSAALREAEEEVGISKDRAEVWCPMSPVLSKSAIMSVVPVFAYVGHVDPSKLKLNPAEVESIISVSLKDLCEPQNSRYTRFRSEVYQAGYTMPTFILTNPAIWGMTAFITHMVLMALLPDLYTMKLHHIRSYPVRN